MLIFLRKAVGEIMRNIQFFQFADRFAPFIFGLIIQTIIRKISYYRIVKVRVLIQIHRIRKPVHPTNFSDPLFLSGGLLFLKMVLMMSKLFLKGLSLIDE